MRYIRIEIGILLGILMLILSLEGCAERRTPFESNQQAEDAIMQTAEFEAFVESTDLGIPEPPKESIMIPEEELDVTKEPDSPEITEEERELLGIVDREFEAVVKESQLEEAEKEFKIIREDELGLPEELREGYELKPMEELGGVPAEAEEALEPFKEETQKEDR